MDSKNNVLTVTVNLSKDSLDRLDVIISQLQQLIEMGHVVPDSQGVVAEAVNKITATQAEPVSPDSDDKKDPGPAPVSDPEPESESVPLAEFQKSVTLKCADPKTDKAAVKALINRYAKSVSGVPADKRQEILDELSRL